MLVFSQKLADYSLVKKTKKSWDYRVIQIVLEMLAHRTPPSCVSANILTFLKYDEQDGTSYVNWCHGIVQSVCNAKTNCVYIKWSQDCLNPGEQSVTKEKLLSSKWNPGKATKGAWRQYFGENEI